MKLYEFEVICGEFLICPELAVENEEVISALKFNDDDALRDALRDNF